MLRKARESTSHKPTVLEKTSSSPAYNTLAHQPYLSDDVRASTSANATTRPPKKPGNGHNVSGAVGPSTVPVVHQQVNSKLAVSLNGRQLLNQRLQKYKLPAVFHANLVGPAQEPLWKGSFWIKGTLLGSSRLEHSKTAAKEAAAMSALTWLNNNHYH
jgi:hypothetical protein